MSALVFLALAVAVSAVGMIVLWARHRQPDTPDASIEEFRSKMRALSEEDSATVSGERSGGRRGG